MSKPRTYTVLDRPAILLFGDSLTQNSFGPHGWGAKLYSTYCRKADVINRGCSGYNSSWAVETVKYALPESRVQLAILWFGANDSVLSSSGVRQYVSPVVYRNNLVRIAKSLRDTYGTGIDILVVTPPPVVEPMRLEHQRAQFKENASGVSDRNNSNTLTYVDACHAAVLELRSEELCNAVAVDMFRAMMLECANVPATALETQTAWSEWQKANEADWGAATDHLRKYFIDGLHFSANGEEFVFQTILSSIENHFPSMTYDQLPNHMPWHIQCKSNPSLLTTLRAPHEVSAILSTVSAPVLFKNFQMWDWGCLRYLNMGWMLIDSSDGIITALSKSGDPCDDPLAVMGDVAGSDVEESGKQVLNQLESPEVVDLGGLFVTPGIYATGFHEDVILAIGIAATYIQQDSHVNVVDLRKCESVDEVVTYLVTECNSALEANSKSVVLATNWNVHKLPDLTRELCKFSPSFATPVSVLGSSKSELTNINNSPLKWDVFMCDRQAKDCFDAQRQSVNELLLLDRFQHEDVIHRCLTATRSFLLQFGILSCSVYVQDASRFANLPLTLADYFVISPAWHAPSSLTPGSIVEESDHTVLYCYSNGTKGNQTLTVLNSSMVDYNKELRHQLDSGNHPCLYFNSKFLFSNKTGLVSSLVAADSTKVHMSEQLFIASRAPSFAEHHLRDGHPASLERSSLRLSAKAQFLVLDKEYHQRDANIRGVCAAPSVAYFKC